MESIFKTPAETQLLALCAQHLDPLGFRVVDVDCRIGHRSLIRIFLEKRLESGVSATTLEDCAEASRTLSPVLEAEGALAGVIPGAFDLEVSSPGLDRRLRVRTDFEGTLGAKVKLKLIEKLEGAANLTGQLLDVDDNGVGVEVSGKQMKVPFGLIKQAIRVWEPK